MSIAAVTRLILGVGIVLLFLAVGVTTSRTMLGFAERQLATQAQDTATALGAALAAPLRDPAGGRAGVEKLMQSVFNRGFYELIDVTDGAGAPLLHLEKPLRAEGVPQWLLASANPAVRTATVQVHASGQVVGTLVMRADPTLALLDAWQLLRNQLVAFALVAAVLLAVFEVLLRRLHRSLQLIADQAVAVLRREYPLNHNVSRLREPRLLGEAMNRMVGWVREQVAAETAKVEQALAHLETDPLTGLLRRERFDERVDASTQTNCGLVLVGLDGMDAFNAEFGRDQGDLLIVRIARSLQTVCAPVANVMIARHRGADLAIWLPNAPVDTVRAIADQAGRAAQDAGQSQIRVHVGASYASDADTLGAHLSRADHALRRAQTTTSGSSRLIVDDDKRDSMQTVVRGAEQWRELLQDAIAANRISFDHHILHASDFSPLQREALARLEIGPERILADDFITWIMQMRLDERFDMHVVERLFDQAADTLPLCINLTATSPINRDFVPWLLERMKTVREPSRFVFELPERAMAINESAAVRLVRALRERGARISIDHFADGGNPFSWLDHGVIDQLKLAPRWVRGIDGRSDARFFVRRLTSMTEAIGVPLYAEAVETEAEWRALMDCGVSGGAGAWLAARNAGR